MFSDRMTLPRITAAALEHLSFPNKTVELVRGRLLVREPPGGWHGAIAVNLSTRLSTFVRPRGSGFVFGQDTGFKIGSDPDTVRGPDVAFVARERLPEIPRLGFVPVAPDLAVEIVSPGDRPGELLEKVGEWLGAGTPLVWVIDPQRVQARVHRADGSLSIVGESDELSGEEIVPGFSCTLREILDIE